MTERRRKIWNWQTMGVIILVAVVIVLLVVALNRPQNNETTANNNTPAAETVKTTETVAKTEMKTEEVDESSEKAAVQKYDEEHSRKITELTGVITYAGKVGDNLVVRVSIDQFVTSGSCAMTVRQGGALMHHETAEIIGDVTTATCDGFVVPMTEFESGTAEIIITLKSGEAEGTLDREVTL